MAVSTIKQMKLPYSDVTTTNGIGYPAIALSKIVSAVALEGTNRTAVIESYNGSPIIRLKDSQNMAQTSDSNITVRVYYLP